MNEWNFTDFLKYLFIRWEGIIFHSRKFSSQSFLSQENCKLIIFEDISTCFSRRFSKLLHSVLWLIFGCEECHINVFVDFLKFFYQWIWNGSQKCVFLEIASVLKIIILPSIEGVLLLWKQSTCCMLFTVSWKFFCTLRVSLYEKWTPKILIVCVVK